MRHLPVARTVTSCTTIVFERPLLTLGLLLILLLLMLVFAAHPVSADGFIIPQPPVDRPIPWRDIPLTVKYHRVNVTIDNQVATTKVDQLFVNDADFAVEGTYIFPLPEDAAVSSFDMWVDGKKLEGKLLGRDEARRIYEDIVRQQKDPALLEYAGRGAFQARIFPIPPARRAPHRADLHAGAPAAVRPRPLPLPAQHREVLGPAAVRGRDQRQR